MRLIRRLKDESGFTMVAAIGALFVVTMLSIAAVSAAGGDIHLSRYDQDDKQAYAAAEAGVNEYLFKLNQDANYWSKCTNVAAPHALNQMFTGAPPPGRLWRDVPGSNSEYSIELLPAPGKTACDPNDPIGSMIDTDGNFKIRSTGRVKGTNNYRAVVATFRRKGFLDFLYFTDLENQALHYLKESFLGQAPTRSTNGSGTPDGGPDLLTWAADKCERHWWGTQAGGEGRGELPVWHGQWWDGNSWEDSNGFDLTTSSVCGEITFASDDAVNGPFHSNDTFRVCGTPEFGRPAKADAVETSAPSPGYVACGGGATPVFNPSLLTSAKELDLPPSNAALSKLVQSSYHFTGPTTLVFNGGNVTVTNAGVNGGSPQSMPLPSNGVIRVKNNACSSSYNPNDTEFTGPGCADVRVSGNYSGNVTVASEKDIIVVGNLTRTSGNTTALMGLIADGFIRVWHPITGSPCANRSDSPTNITIHAAILSLNGSFTVDNYQCGAPLGTLTVDGAIAQRHRGVVGQGGSSIVHGYIKNYNYNEQLKYRSPPHFLDPVQAAWRILRHAEETPAR
jgi:hypothetical protein